MKVATVRQGSPCTTPLSATESTVVVSRPSPSVRAMPAGGSFIENIKRHVFVRHNQVAWSLARSGSIKRFDYRPKRLLSHTLPWRLARPKSPPALAPPAPYLPQQGHACTVGAGAAAVVRLARARSHRVRRAKRQCGCCCCCRRFPAPQKTTLAIEARPAVSCRRVAAVRRVGLWRDCDAGFAAATQGSCLRLLFVAQTKN